MRTNFKFMCTAIGSMPFTDVEHAIKTSIKYLPDAPIWPQLPRLGLNEQMEIQYSEGMPSVVINKEKGNLYFETESDYSITFADFYEKYMISMGEDVEISNASDTGNIDEDTVTFDCSNMAITPLFSQGIYAFEHELIKSQKIFPFIKVHTIGPISFSLMNVDKNGKSIYYNEEFRDVIVKALAMKSKWQIQKFKPYAKKIICFIDEPALSSYGSSVYISVKREDIVALLSETVDAIHSEGGLAGIHCCGNTEWPILIESGVDIINFDAFEYGETICLYPDEMKTFLNRGGILAWGIVPTSLCIREQSVETLEQKLEIVMNKLAAKGIDKNIITAQSIITPSCGTGSMEPEDAQIVFEKTFLLSKAMKQKYGY